ncbi:MAG: alpha/beta hydrolase [Mariniphaga sp.]|nr:alpha/beta hydrolase [Mariniphaga sp.]
MKAIKIISGIVILPIATYFLGPKMPEPVLNAELPVVTTNIGEFVSHLETVEKVKPGNEAKIIWANDSVHAQTEYVLLYLHGFSASRMEGYPVNEDFPKRYGCNAYLARLASHGLVTENPLIDMTPYRLYESAKLALVIAQQLGKKVIIMGTSTGGTLALKLAADFPEMVYGLILYSPNVRIKQKASVLLSKPWGLQIAKLNFGGDFRVSSEDPTSEICKYWYCSYRAEGPVFLQQLVDVTMTEKVFAKVKCPLFFGYYFKDEQHQDETVEVKAGLKMFRQVGTPVSFKQAQAFPDAGSHVIACSLTSKSVDAVAEGTYGFTESILKMVPK